MILKKTKLSKIISTLIASGLFAASANSAFAAANNGGGGFVKAEPFAALSAQVEANTLAIQANSASIELLNAEVNAINVELDSMTTLILANEQSIQDALVAIENNTTQISVLRTDLYDLKLQINTDITNINGQLTEMRGNVATLTGNLAALSQTVSQTTTDLQAAIAANSSEITSLSATLSVMTSNLAVAQSNITVLQVQVSNAEALLVNHQQSIDDLDTRLSALEFQVANGAVTAPSSEADTGVVNGSFTLTDTDASVDDFSTSEFVNKLQSLNIQNGSYIHASAVGANGNTAVCTNDPNAIVTIDAYLNSTNLSKNLSNVTDVETWSKDGNNAWKIDSNVMMYSVHYPSFNYLSFSGSIYVLPEGYGSTIPSELYIKNIWTSNVEQSVTITTGTSRLAACGF
ncbi:MAG: hypothetical protein OEY19_10235 [Gammaproteobacteria bacterium]|nr:hypothetical protein [Gammaproteobacteria bacterium]MDH5630905.1 hypothetical protein [Gammaproteobacteria bacterium]